MAMVFHDQTDKSMIESTLSWICIRLIVSGTKSCPIYIDLAVLGRRFIKCSPSKSNLKKIFFSIGLRSLFQKVKSVVFGIGEIFSENFVKILS